MKLFVTPFMKEYKGEVIVTASSRLFYLFFFSQDMDRYGIGMRMRQTVSAHQSVIVYIYIYIYVYFCAYMKADFCKFGQFAS